MMKNRIKKGEKKGLFFTSSANAALSIAAVALVNRGPSLNSAEVEGSNRQMLGTNAALNGDTAVNGNLLVPGTPAVTINGTPTYGGTIDGTGSELPTGYTVTINSGTALGHVVRRIDRVPLPVISIPVAPCRRRPDDQKQFRGPWLCYRTGGPGYYQQ
jgi:hypothetical protein